MATGTSVSKHMTCTDSIVMYSILTTICSKEQFGVSVMGMRSDD